MTHVQISSFPVTYRATGLDIKVSIPRGLLDMKKFDKELPKVLKNIAKEAKQFWESEAGRKLKTARVKYRDGIEVTVVDNRTIILGLNKFGGSLERGKSFDMKPGFMNSAKVKINGQQKLPKFVSMMLAKAPISVPTMRKYLIIPMRWSQGGTKFRTVSDKSPVDSWMWKRKDENKEIDLTSAVVKELQDNIIPKHFNEAIVRVWKQT